MSGDCWTWLVRSGNRSAAIMHHASPRFNVQLIQANILPCRPQVLEKLQSEELHHARPRSIHDAHFSLRVWTYLCARNLLEVNGHPRLVGQVFYFYKTQLRYWAWMKLPAQAQSPQRTVHGTSGRLSTPLIGCQQWTRHFFSTRDVYYSGQNLR